MMQQYRNAKQRSFMFDYDGTLTTVDREPRVVIPEKDQRKTDYNVDSVTVLSFFFFLKKRKKRKKSKR
jgi:hypothetical protein